MKTMADYVIIGAGSAGCVLANRLSADPSVNVILIEAGKKNSHLFYRMPAGFFPLMNSGRGNWKLETIPQPGLNGRKMYVPRGKVLGGSSCLNAMVYVRGNAGDYDAWRQMGNTGWSYEDCLPYFRKLESSPIGSSEYRGGEGPVKITAGPARHEMSPISQAWVEAAVRVGYPYNPDMNGASQEGFGPAEGNFADGVRQSTSEAYLKPIWDRPNLKVITEALVTRIVIENGRATGVEYFKKGLLKTAHADVEVILSGGAVSSPHILQLSGIGNPSLLRQHDIKTLVDLPDVGENLLDHLSVNVAQEVTKPYSALQFLRPAKSLRLLAQYVLFKSGMMTANGLESMAFVKSSKDLEYPDIQYHLPLLMYHNHGRDVVQREGFLAHATACHPQSRGTIKLVSRDPAKSPEIDPRYLQYDEELRPLRAAIRIAREIIAQSDFDEFRGPEYQPGAGKQSDEDLNTYIRNTAISVYHLAGTCRMGEDEAAVVDPKLRVRGIERLRVVDASIMPRLPTGNTNAPTMMIAEKAADMILGAA
jgi:choline dehydrogenase